MPTVPFGSPRTQTRPKIDETYIAMAASDLHDAGMLFAQQTEPYTISIGPEYNKWDEALTEHGRIRIPKELDEPQKWMNQHNKMLDSNGIIREDRPDGSVVLTRQYRGS